MTKDEALKLIQPGSVVSVEIVEKLKFNNIFQHIALWWGTHVELEPGKKEHLKYSANHSAEYFGSGNNEIVEANGGVVKKRPIPFLVSSNRVYFFHNINLTVENLQKGKDEAYSRVFVRKGLDIKGRVYDLMELFRFPFPGLKDNPNADICSRLVWDINKIMSLPMVDEDNHGRISPARIQDYLIDSVLNGNSDGWFCSTVWNRDRFQPLSEVI